MERQTVPFTYQFEEAMRQLDGDGLLLAATNPAGASNVMTIGWGTIGVVWGMPIFVVLVRPSRYTCQFIEESGEFTVNVPTPAMKDTVVYCGTRSGREVDKFAQPHMAVSPGRQVGAITLDACPLVYECRVVQKNDVLAATLDHRVLNRYYRGGDFHCIYYGEILGAYAWE